MFWLLQHPFTRFGKWWTCFTRWYKVLRSGRYIKMLKAETCRASKSCRDCWHTWSWSWYYKNRTIHILLLVPFEERSARHNVLSSCAHRHSLAAQAHFWVRLMETRGDGSDILRRAITLARQCVWACRIAGQTSHRQNTTWSRPKYVFKLKSSRLVASGLQYILQSWTMYFDHTNEHQYVQCDHKLKTKYHPRISLPTWSNP